MRIKFTEAPKGREYKVGDEVDFRGHVAEGYARKYIDRGWAVEIPAQAPVARASTRVEPAKEPVAVVDAPKPEAPKPQQSGGGSRQGLV